MDRNTKVEDDILGERNDTIITVHKYISVIDLIKPCFLGLYMLISAKNDMEDDDVENYLKMCRAEIPNLEKRIYALQMEEIEEKENARKAIINKEKIKFLRHKKRITQIGKSITKFSNRIASMGHDSDRIILMEASARSKKLKEIKNKMYDKMYGTENKREELEKTNDKSREVNENLDEMDDEVDVVDEEIYDEGDWEKEFEEEIKSIELEKEKNELEELKKIEESRRKKELDDLNKKMKIEETMSEEILDLEKILEFDTPKHKIKNEGKGGDGKKKQHKKL